jgi:hypothetical protein
LEVKIFALHGPLKRLKKRKKKDEDEGRKLCICVGGKLGLFLATKKLIVTKITTMSKWGGGEGKMRRKKEKKSDDKNPTI